MTDPFVMRFDPPLRQSPLAGHAPLKGLSFAVKDLFDVAGTPTLNGLKDWPDPKPKAQHAGLVQQILDLGGEIVGKVITEQLAHSTIGINPDYGTPTNARDGARVPGGSSSGSGSAVALGLCDVGLGSDTGGSVRIPAAYQGLWGLRPSLGTLDLRGVMELAPRFDTPGFLTRDLATLTRVHQALTPGTAKALKLAVPTAVWSHYGLQAPLKGETSVAAIDLPWDEGVATRLSTAFRFAQAIEVTERLGHLADDNTLNLHPMIRARLVWNKSVTQGDCDAAFDDCAGDLAALKEALAPDTALLWPTIAEPAPLITAAESWGEAHRARQFALTAPAGLLGAPQLHIPKDAEAGGLGFSLIGRRGADLDLLKTAEAILN